MAVPTPKRTSAAMQAPPGFSRETSWNHVEQVAPRIDVKFPILGFLMDGEATGYDLKRRFRDPVGFFYRVSDGSLYPALKKLARDGLVTQREERRGKRSRTFYAITPAGRERFLRMLREPAQPVFVFDETQVKIFFAHHDPRAALFHMSRTYQQDLERAAMLRWIAREMERNNESVFRKALIEIGYAVTQAKARIFSRLLDEVKGKVAINGRARARTSAAPSSGRRGSS
jgi:DNA-binding PadR family transcriptional regulator